MTTTTMDAEHEQLPTAQLADEMELRRQALEETVTARAELVTDGDDDEEAQPVSSSSDNKNNHKKRLLLWWGVTGLVVVIGVIVAVVVVVAMGGGDDDDDDDDDNDPLINSDTPAPRPTVAPTGFTPTLTPSSRAPTWLRWEASQILQGYFDDGDEAVLGNRGRFGHDVALSTDPSGESITIMATFGQEQMFGSSSVQNRYAAFPCDREGECGAGTPVTAATLPVTAYAWKVAVVREYSLVVAAQDALFWNKNKCQLENSTGAQDVATNVRGDLVAGLGSDRFVWYDAASLDENDCPSLLDSRSGQQQQARSGFALAVDGRRVAAGFNTQDPSMDPIGMCSPCQPEDLFFQGYRVLIVDSDTGEESAIEQGEGWSLVGRNALSLAANGTLLAIGSSFARVPRSIGYATRQDGGQVQVWQREGEGSTWVTLGSTISSPQQGDRFGTSVALSADGTILAVGAPNDPTNGLGSGRVAVYRWMDGDWVQFGEDFLGFTRSALGASLAMTHDGSQILVGAPDSPRFGPDTGEVHLYTLVAG